MMKDPRETFDRSDFFLPLYVPLLSYVYMSGLQYIPLVVVEGWKMMFGVDSLY